MTFPYESQSPERFQQFCQSLLLESYPDLQCLPVGQPDGGRDAISGFRKVSDQTIVQVKFVRNPIGIENPLEWFTKIIEGELPKIEKLILRGAARYVFVSNMPGTAHLDSGSIDKFQKTLDDLLSIPAQALWRDDLDRRLERQWNLKLAFPELMTGQDFLRLAMEAQPNEALERRSTAIELFLKATYDRDIEVKFKQVQLQNKLLDLFVDIPVAINISGNSIGDRRKSLNTFKALQLELEQTRSSDLERKQKFDFDMFFFRQDTSSYFSEQYPMGAAEVILSSYGTENFEKILIDGAPGQGKSTISQYLCQVHRIILLGETDDLKALKEHHRTTLARLPFRIDLRDFASWTSGLDPFTPENKSRTNGNVISVESFLAAQISYFSGGGSFEVDDLFAVVKRMPIFLAFDGLDEIGELEKRERVVDQIVSGAKRLKSLAPSVQLIITSRPTTSPLPKILVEEFTSLSLISLSQSSISDYAANWMKARNLDKEEQNEFNSILKNKLSQAHIKDLARNPMQLAILLSLIHTRGASLPDKRTALYDQYIDLFFSRESEKSKIVRNHRELLLDIHRYLAWILHSEAEKGNDRGSITAENLRKLLTDYLVKEGRNSDLVDKLFEGIVDRIVAIVSRVEGTFEFEVQPLREYFAARHLYESAPYSPPGREEKGTKPDRFDVIARKSYWQNVTRFFCGCFSKGEQPVIVERLSDLLESPDFKLTSYPRLLTLTLLSDWVFSQNPKSLNRLLDMFLDETGIRFVVMQIEKIQPSNTLISLNSECGSDKIMLSCFNLLAKNPISDLTDGLTTLIILNGNAEKIQQIWSEYIDKCSPQESTKWFFYGLYLGTLKDIDDNKLLGYIGGKTDFGFSDRIECCLGARKSKVIQDCPELFDQVVEDVLSSNISGFRRNADTLIEYFIAALDPIRYVISMDADPSYSVAEIWERSSFGQLDFSEAEFNIKKDSSENYDKCFQVAQLAHSLSQESTKYWSSKLEPWSTLIELVREKFGENWKLFEFANTACLAKEYKKAAKTSLYDSSIPLVERVAFGRRNSSNSIWWKNEFQTSETTDNTILALMTCLTWANSDGLIKLARVIDKLLKSLPEELWSKLFNSLQHVGRITGGTMDGRRSLKLDANKLPNSLSARTALVLCIRSERVYSYNIFDKYLVNYKGNSNTILNYCEKFLVDRFFDNPLENYFLLEQISWFYKKNSKTTRRVHSRYFIENTRNSIPLDVVKTILREVQSYPVSICTFADSVLIHHLTEKTETVAVQAKEQNWFK